MRYLLPFLKPGLSQRLIIQSLLCLRDCSEPGLSQGLLIQSTVWETEEDLDHQKKASRATHVMLQQVTVCLLVKQMVWAVDSTAGSSHAEPWCACLFDLSCKHRWYSFWLTPKATLQESIPKGKKPTLQSLPVTSTASVPQATAVGGQEC